MRSYCVAAASAALVLAALTAPAGAVAPNAGVAAGAIATEGSSTLVEPARYYRRHYRPSFFFYVPRRHYYYRYRRW